MFEILIYMIIWSANALHFDLYKQVYLVHLSTMQFSKYSISLSGRSVAAAQNLETSQAVENAFKKILSCNN